MSRLSIAPPRRTTAVALIACVLGSLAGAAGCMTPPRRVDDRPTLPFPTAAAPLAEREAWFADNAPVATAARVRTERHRRRFAGVGTHRVVLGDGHELSSPGALAPWLGPDDTEALATLDDYRRASNLRSLAPPLYAGGLALALAGQGSVLLLQVESGTVGTTLPPDLVDAAALAGGLALVGGAALALTGAALDLVFSTAEDDAGARLADQTREALRRRLALPPRQVANASLDTPDPAQPDPAQPDPAQPEAPSTSEKPR